MAFSGQTFAIGFLISSLTGIVLGIIFGWYRWARLLSNPIVTSFYSMPRVAMVPLIIMWVGTGMKSKIYIVFLFSFFPILVNTIAGVKALDQDLLRAARAYCATDWQIFKTVALPGSVPFILTGIRQGVSLGLIGVVIGEMLGGGSQGIGYMVAYGGQTFQTDTMFVGVVIIAFAESCSHGSPKIGTTIFTMETGTLKSMGIRDLPNDVPAIVRYQQRPIESNGNSSRAPIDFLAHRVRYKSAEERLRSSGRFPIVERNKNDIIAGSHPPVP